MFYFTGQNDRFSIKIEEFDILTKKMIREVRKLKKNKWGKILGD